MTTVNCGGTDVLSIVGNSPFIPEGREHIYAKGLHAGLTGDFLTAAHLLIPQLENSIRWILSQRGIVTSGLNSEGIQEEHDLNRMLKLPELNTILGEDFAFDLRGLLIERFGSNLRNLTTHGLIDYGGFFAPQMSYLWWLTLRLCCLPLIIQARKNRDTPPEPSTA